MRILTEALPLDRVSISMTINSTASILLALLLAVARERGIAWSALSGHGPERPAQGVRRARDLHLPAPAVAEDHDGHLRVLRRRGAALEHDLDLRATTSARPARRPSRRSPSRSRTRSPTSRPPWRAASPSTTSRRASRFFFNAHSNFFEEVAKFRAARSLWAEIARDRFGAKDPRSWRLRFHTQTAGSTLTAQQPDVNVVRVALQALSAVLGGTQSLHTNARDEALALPTEESARLALRTQQVIANETGVADVVGPARRLAPGRGLDGGDPRAGARAIAQGRRARRRRRGDREGILPAGDRGRRLHGPARDRGGQAADRRRQRVPRGERADPVDPVGRPGPRGGADRAPARVSGLAGRRRQPRGARRAAARRARGPEPHAGARRGGFAGAPRSARSSPR